MTTTVVSVVTGATFGGAVAICNSVRDRVGSGAMLQAATLIALSLTAAPTGDQVKSVLDYFYMGQGQPAILADANLCQTNEKKVKERKFDCTTAFGTSAKKGETVNVYLTFLVPKGDEAEFMVQSLHNGVVRSTKDVTVKGGSIRSRTWRAFTLKKAGKWEFKVLKGTEVIKTLSITAE